MIRFSPGHTFEQYQNRWSNPVCDSRAIVA